ncbi:hypothetical protein [Winogradskyella sp. R77965]|uniref:hypothetical protein n=1 Tax=Winogradskyella sp. R77965 TaxID=3093872 RepID=UPI0037DC597E
MRFVTKPDADKNTLLLSRQSTLTSLLDIAVNSNKAAISGSVYREPYPDAFETKSRVEDKLALTYFNKCAYCEKLAKADIEHYRPKGKVKEDNTHNGYYWLCYEWTNLLPSCVKCNRDGGKHSKFPISGIRIALPTLLPGPQLDLSTHKANHATLLNEEPLILHPEIDNPENYFGFKHDQNRKGIEIYGTDNGNRGDTTISVCKLNRQELRIERLRIITDFKTAVNHIFKKRLNNTINDNQLVDRLIDSIELMEIKSNDVEFDHTLFRKFMLKSQNNFNLIVISCLENSQRIIVLEAYNTYYS